MLRVTVDLEPFGDPDEARTIAQIEIINVTQSGGRLSQDYAWRIQEAATGVLAMGWLVDWNRQPGPLTLVNAVLDQWQSGRDLPIDNHGRPAHPMPGTSAAEFWQQHDDARHPKTP